MMAFALPSRAQYGCLPLDVFILEHWNYELPITQDALQWKTLVKRYLALTPAGRHTYHIVASKNKHLDSSTIQSSGQTDRALRPFQTAQERVICADAASSRKRPVWLRTCYTVAQQRDYDDLVSRADAFSGQGYSIGEELNDASRYDVKSEWSSVLLQIPSIIDAEQDDKKQKETNDKLVPGSEPGTLEEASAQNSTLIYLVDQEALDEGLVKIKWLGQYGQCIWENKIVPELLMGFREALEKGASLAELVGDMTENGATISR